MFSCINVSFDIIEYKFVFVRSPCFKCSFCSRRFTTIIYSVSFTHTHPTGQTAEATRRQVGLLQGSKFHESGKNKKKKKKKKKIKQNREKNNRMQILFIHFRGNCPVYNQICNTWKKRNYFAKMCPSNKHAKENYAEWLWFTSISGRTTLCRLHHSQNIVNNTHTRKTYEVNSTSEDWFVTLELNGTKTRFKINSVK